VDVKCTPHQNALKDTPTFSSPINTEDKNNSEHSNHSSDLQHYSPWNNPKEPNSSLFHSSSDAIQAKCHTNFQSSNTKTHSIPRFYLFLEQAVILIM